MSKEQTLKLVQDVVAAYQRCLLEAATLTNEQLDKKVALGQREVPARGILYNMVAHPREHAVHLQKLLQKTSSPAAQPTEAQLIAAEAAEAFGALAGMLARTTDDDLDREFEGHTPRKVLEHVKFAYELYIKGIQQAKS